MAVLYDVIIVGAGPVGLLLACELSLADVSVLILERDLNPESPRKQEPLGARGMNTPSIESFYRRGMLGGLADLSQRNVPFQKTPGFRFGGHFAGIPFNANKLELNRWKYRLDGPGLIPLATSLQKVENVLAEQAEKLGVTILRGQGVEKISLQDDHGVEVEAGEDHQVFRGRWLVGCDGGRSVIRKAADFRFEGTEAKFTGYAIQCELDHPEKLKPGFNPTSNGMYLRGHNGGLHLLDFDGGANHRAKEITQECLQEILNRVTGLDDLLFTKVHFVSSYTDRCMQATSYRKGRILLAGDAAHIHSPLGAQGMNLGLGDAMNLGWKLAATVQQDKKRGNEPLDLSLLDTYDTERRPVGAWALDWTRAQVSILQPGPFGAAIRKVVSDLIDTVDGTNMFMDQFWGLSQRCILDGIGGNAPHPAMGLSVPDFEFEDGSRLGSKMKDGKGLVIDFQNKSALRDMAAEAHLEYLNLKANDNRDLGVVIVRPDGIVAWAISEDEELDLDAVKTVLKKWFGL